MRVALVNDTPMACEALRRIVVSAAGRTVAWVARDGAEAVAMAGADTPDLILMDLHMPVMDGAEATRRIMAETPCPILIVTATVSGHMNQVYEAMGHGALDAVDTPTLGPDGQVAGASHLLDKIATVGKLFGFAGAVAVRSSPPATRLVILGTSTGGPNALAKILGGLPADLAACVIMVQHIDQDFSSGLARWLGEHAGRRVEVIVDGDRPAPGRLLLTGTNDHLVMDPGRRLRYTAEPREQSYRPNVDIFFSSVAAYWPAPGVAAVLTGMGRDGAVGLLTLRRLGWHTIAQDSATSVVDSMPRAAAEVGAAAEVLPLEQIAGSIAARVLSSGP